MEKEFNLSEKIIPFRYKRKDEALQKEDVKEFIKRLKDFVRSDRWTVLDMLYEIDKLAGDDLK